MAVLIQGTHRGNTSSDVTRNKWTKTVAYLEKSQTRPSKTFGRPRFVLLHEMMISSAENAESPTKCLLVELSDGTERSARVEIVISRHPSY